MGSPVPFIQVDEATKQLVVSQQARETLSSFEGTVGVCAVAGVYRTGAHTTPGSSILAMVSAFEGKEGGRGGKGGGKSPIGLRSEIAGSIE